MTNNIERAIEKILQRLERVERNSERAKTTETPLFWDGTRVTIGSAFSGTGTGGVFTAMRGSHINAAIVSRNATGGGVSLQGVADSAASFDRGGIFHNARWNHVSQQWEVDPISANDAHAILFKNNGGIDFIIHPSTGNTSRTFTHADFIAGKKAGIDTSGNLTLSGVIQEESWTNLTLTGGWVDYASGYPSPAYYKDKQGRVYLRGLIKDGTIGAAFATLPSGYRPTGTITQVTLSGGNVLGRVDVTSAGVCTASVGNNGWISLNGISFRTT